ncbi:MAG: quinol:cytochrome C oxidoreductase [Candidatus Krumholzibacteriia bacterium]
MFQHQAPRLADTRTTLDGLGGRVFAGASIVGLAALAASIALGMAAGDGLRRFAYSYLTSYAFFLAIALGALLFVPLQYLTRASWSVILRRPVELMAASIPLLALLSLPVLLNLPALYEWAHTDLPPEQAELLAHKQSYLSVPFFLARWVAYFAIWSGIALWYWRTSVRQDDRPDPRLTLLMERRSGPAIVIYAVTVTLASMDLLMTLDFVWFSTIWGIFYFAGGFVSFFAVLTLLMLALQLGGRLERVVSMEHYHDLGKGMFAFSFFWAYIAFSQYMLYWYANIPEETIWFLERSGHGWGTLGVALIFGAFVAPFLGLVSRHAKRSRALLAFWAVWILVFQWLNVFWVTMPDYSPHAFTFALLDVTCFVAIAGLWIAGVTLLARRGSLVPTGDPRLQDSLEFENA